jgi:hypothetical protein
MLDARRRRIAARFPIKARLRPTEQAFTFRRPPCLGIAYPYDGDSFPAHEPGTATLSTRWFIRRRQSTWTTKSMKELAHPDTAEMIATGLSHTIESTLIIARNEY